MRFATHALVGVLVLIGACAHNTPQDKRTGPDGKAKGATEIKLVNNQGKVRGIVTYPGGDRVDWKYIELPAKQVGRLEFTLTWDVPRPGLRLGFDVFDQYFHPVASSSKQRARGRTRDAFVDNAQGKYYVRIFAERRRDAGRYKLVADLKPAIAPTDFDPLTVAVSDPPPLADTPDIPEPCTNETFSVTKKECKSFCPDPRSLAPRDWKACSNVCDTPDAENPACWSSMECPRDKPNRNLRKCTADKFPACNWAAPDAGNPNCDSRPPIVARIQKYDGASGNLDITIPAGSDQGVSTKWSGFVLQGMAGQQALPNGSFQIVRVDRTNSLARVKLTTDQIKQNPRVKLLPPKP